MVMLDYDYDGEIFVFDAVIYASEIEANNWEIHIPIQNIGNQVMIIYIDIYEMNIRN